MEDESSDSEYFPSSELSSESCNDVADENLNDISTQPVNTSNTNKSNTSFEINKSVEAPAAKVLDDKDLYLPTSSSGNKDKKKNCCLFCKKLQTKIARHLELTHSSEPEVRKFSLLPKKCSERLKIIDTIRRKGNFYYNTDSNISKEECDAQVAHLLRGTKLRKHIATFCASMELADTEVSDLANLMGHAEKIHKEVYRQPVISRDILNITQHLEAAHGCDSKESEESFSEDDKDAEEIREENNEITIHEGTNVDSSIDTSISEDTSELRIKRHSRTNVDSSIDTSISEDTSELRIKRRSSSPYGRTKRTRWNENEKTVVLTAFNQVMTSGKLPSLQEIYTIIRQNSCLKNRTSAQVKTWLHNQLKKKRQLTKLN